MFISIIMSMMLMFIYFFNKFQILFMILLLMLFLVLMISNFKNLIIFCWNSTFMILDYTSIMFLFLTIFISIMMFINSFNNNKYLFLIYMILMNILLVCFMINNLFLFYIFFEFSLIPLILLLILKGPNFERFQSSLYMLIFTLLFSLIFLCLMFFLKIEKNINLNYIMFLNKIKSKLIMFMILVFLVKFPLYSLHIWLPKAHVESPVEGSMILAGVLLKLGVFGLLRFMKFVCIYKYSFISIIYIFSLVGGFISGMICFRQIDMKVMIAYSSVSHMGLLLSGLATMNKTGETGAIIMCVSHGFCSSGLFYNLNIYYESIKTRNIYMMKGLNNIFNISIIMWLVLCICNMGTPPSMNFMSEIMLIISILKKSFFSFIILFLLMTMSVAYCLNMFIRVGHGSIFFMFFEKKESFSMMIVMLFHILFLFNYLLNVKCLLMY